MKHYCVHKFLALLLVAVGYATSSWGQNVAKVGTTEYATLAEAFEKATNGNTITALTDISDFGAITFTGKALTLDLSGKTISGTSITIGTGASLSIGKKNSNTYPTVDANYNVTYAASNGVVKLTKSITAKDGGTFTLYKGKIESDYVAIFVKGDITGNSDIKSAATIYGGYVKAQEFCVSPQGKGATVTIGYSTTAKNAPVLESLDNAVIAGNGTNEEGKRLGGTSITLNRSCVLIARIQSEGYAACGIYHPQEGTLKIAHNTVKIVAINGTGILMRGGQLTMSAGTVIATGDKNFTGKVGDSRVVVGTSGIVFDLDANYYDADNTSINISGTSTSITGAKSAIDLINTNGYDVANKFAVTGGKFSSDVTPYLKPGYDIEENNGIYTAVKYLAQMGDTKYTSIPTIQTALNDAADGSTIKILNDFSQLSYQLSFTKKITLDLNGKNASLHSLKITAGGDLTITDKSTEGASILSLNGSGSAIQVSGGGIVTIEKGTIKNTFSSQDAHKNIVVRVEGDDATGAKSTLNIKGGKITTEGTPVFVCYKGATVNMTGGELTASGLACIAGNGTDKGGTTINISGGTLNASPADNASAACGIYHPQEGTLNITGGTINVTDGVGVLVRGGQLTMTDGTINATGDATKLGTVGDSRVAIGTSGVILDRDSNYPSVPTAEVKIDKEAKVNGAKASVEVLNDNKVEGAEKAVTISGGTYNSDVSKYCVDGYTATPNANGTYGISEVGDGMVVYADRYENLVAGGSVTIDMDKAKKMLITADVADVDVSLARTYNNTGWHAISLPFSVTLTADMTAQFGFAKLYNLSLNESEAPAITFKTLQTGDKLPAGLPCLIKSNTTGTQTLAVGKVNIQKDVMKAETCTSIEEIYTFYPVLQNTYTADKNGYLLYSGDPSTFAYNENASAYIQPLRYYMTIQNKRDGSYILPTQSGAQKVRMQVIGDGEATGITDIDTDAKAAQGKVYNLQGVQVGTSTEGLPSGVYIQNGRKIIVK